MFVQLTNANPQHHGQPISIRRDLIVTVYANAVVRDSGIIEPVTYLFVPPHGTWEVRESFDQVMELLNANDGTRNTESSKRNRQ
jgi:hypothetical protein